MGRWFGWLVLLLIPLMGWGQETMSLAQVSEVLTENNHLYGASIPPEALRGRVVLVWNLTSELQQLARQVYDNKRAEDSSKLEVDKEEGSPYARIKEMTKAIRSASKGALKDGRLLGIAVVSPDEDPEMRRAWREAVRMMKPAFSVYAAVTASQLFSSTGECLAADGRAEVVKDWAEGDRLKNALEAAPDYLPGRIVLFRTKHHEAVTKRLVEGKNVEQALPKLRREAGGSGERAEEASRVVQAVEQYISGQCSAIEAHLQSAPSRAVDQIARFSKTAPTAARRYMGALNALRRSREVKQMGDMHDFIAAANAGKMGRGDIGRAADGYLKVLATIASSKNASLAAEATALQSALQPFTSEALEKEQSGMREQLRAKRKAEREKEKEEAKARRESGGSGEEAKAKRTQATAASVLQARAGEAIAPFITELAREDDETCNYETLRAGYTKYGSAESARATAAKAVIDTIDGMRSEHLTNLRDILKRGQLLDLFSQEHWETTLTVHFPSLASTDEGREALRVLRDSEVRHIYGVLEDVQTGEPRAEEGASGTEHEIAKVQYKQTKLKALLKYRNTKSPYGRSCVAQLNAMGFDEAAIKAKQEELAQRLKDIKQSMKESEKESKKSGRNRNRND